MESKNVKENYYGVNGVRSIEEVAKKLVGNAELYNGINTGFEQLDSIINGLHKGNLILLCGRPGVGKNTFMLDIVRKICSANKNIMLFSLCLSEEQLVKRLAPDLDNILLESLFRNLYFYDGTTISIEELISKCIKVKQENLLDVLIIDLLQKKTVNGNRIGRGRFSSRDDDCDRISIGLRTLAKDLNIQIIVLADNERADEDKFGISVYDDVINITASEADVVLLMGVNNSENDNIRFVDLFIAKNKNGKTGTLRYKFDDSKQCFYEEQFTKNKND